MNGRRTLTPAAPTSEWDYSPADPLHHWDEVLDASGSPRPQWRRLIVALRRMGLPEFSRRWEAGQRVIQANGVTYNVHGDPRGRARPWPMDLVPLAIDAAEWARIERAVVQRATLLNAILADVYGSQRLLYDGHLPPDLVFRNPAYLRPVRGLRPNADVFLYSYAVDIARAPDGAWWVIADRTQAPSGAGYAMENRLVSARTLPALLDQCQVQPLHAFFDATITALLALAPRQPDTPRVVVLSPGPNSETYFEHAFFARQWDFPLVGGADLTVRDGRVFLKTLAGLNPVDVILRRLDDDFADPLELRTDSLLGVPGLVQAVRSGSVFIANSLGSGVVETPALMAFLPGLCRQLLGEDLHMPSVATWWCGQQEPRRQVLAQLDSLVIKPAFPRFGQHAEFSGSMTEAERGALAARIEAAPEAFVAQEQVDLSTTAVHTPQGLEPRHVVLRALAAWNGHTYAVLPGGLTRVATGRQSLVVSMQAGGGSKDTWVVGRSTGRQPTPQRLRESASYLTTSELSSRMADNLFWLGRYVERLETSARLVRALLPELSGESEHDRNSAIDTTLHYLKGLNEWPEQDAGLTTTRQPRRLQRVLTDIVFDVSRPSSVAWYVQVIHRLSWEVKERLSPDTWRVIQQLEEAFADGPSRNPERRIVSAMARLDEVVMMTSAFAGLLAENPTRGHGWRFLGMGRRLERALQMVALLRVGVAQAPYPDDAYLEVLLCVADSSTAYRSRYLAAIRTRYVLDLLLVDEANPRSVAFQAAALAERIRELPRHADDRADRPDLILAERLVKAVQAEQPERLKKRSSTGSRPALDAHLHALHRLATELSDALTARYLSHSAQVQLPRA